MSASRLHFSHSTIDFGSPRADRQLAKHIGKVAPRRVWQGVVFVICLSLCISLRTNPLV